MDRYSRQILLPQIGAAGQKRLGAARAVVAGCGALGTNIANLLARAGVGHLVVIDRDFIEENNLQRQVLFDEQDCRDNLPKAVAAERKLKQINSQIAVEGVVADIHPANVESFVKGADVVVDGADNFETRFLINDACVKLGVPWVYGAAVGTTGMSLTIIPGQTPCLRCVFENAPPPGVSPTCDTAGVLGAVTGLIGAYEAAEAIKICAGARDAASPTLFSIDLWTGETHQMKVAAARQNADCPACKHHRFEFLEGQAASQTTRLCGRDAIQINPRHGQTLDLTRLAARLGDASELSDMLANPFLLRFTAPGGDDKRLQVTLFADGRAIVKGTKDVSEARALYAKYIGT